MERQVYRRQFGRVVEFWDADCNRYVFVISVVVLSRRVSSHERAYHICVCFSLVLYVVWGVFVKGFGVDGRAGGAASRLPRRSSYFNVGVGVQCSKDV